MHTLFRLPPPKRFAPTPYQLRMLDLIALREGVELPPIPTQSRGVLRRLLSDKLVGLIAMGPSRYKLTQVGRLVRSRHATRFQRGSEHSRAGAPRQQETLA